MPTDRSPIQITDTLRARVVVGQSSIHGMGLFAAEKIAKGAPVTALTGVVCRGADLGEDTRAIQIGPDEFLVEQPGQSGPDDYLNHSCEPNLGFVDGSLMLFALRDIASGEEMFIDYSTSMNLPGWVVPCRCGAAKCRGEIRSFCDLPKSEQRRLQGIVLAYLRQPGPATK